MRKSRPVVLSIAGFDPSSGAGITADIKTMAAHGCYGITCITALTVQSTRGVKRVVPVRGEIISETLNDLAGDFRIAAVKIGMLASVDAVKAVAVFLQRHRFKNVVLDPIFLSSSGAHLLTREGVRVLEKELVKRADVITPNIDEAAALSGLRVSGTADLRAASLVLHKLGSRNVIITGGHLDPPTDFLSMNSGAKTKEFTGRKIATRSTHGTGCAFSTALACNLAGGRSLAQSTAAARAYVRAALKSARRLGKGIGPVV